MLKAPPSKECADSAAKAEGTMKNKRMSDIRIAGNFERWFFNGTIPPS